MNNNNLFDIKNLNLGYNNNIIVENLNFTVNQEDYLCIIGQNGSGKSTLMKTLLGIQKSISGEIKKNFTSGIGYLPQQTIIQKDFPASVKEVVMSGFQQSCGIRPFYNKKEKEKALLNMEKTNIIDIQNKCYRELSGGQQQRVLLARALCATKRILLLDEPVTGLDPIATKNMYKLLNDLHKEGICIIMISHDIYSGLDNATHILKLGNPIIFDTKDNYIKKGENRENTLSTIK